MKFFFALSFFFLSCSNNYSNQSIIGKWTGMSGGVRGDVYFDSTGSVTLVRGNNVIGGDGFVKDGRPAKFIYQADYNQSPKNIDLILIDIETNKELGRTLGIFEFIEKDKMNLCLSSGTGKRPKSFIAGNDQNWMTLTRVN